MKHLSLNIRLLIAFGVLLICAVVSQEYVRKSKPLEYISIMEESVNLTKKWFSVVEEYKKEKGIRSDAVSNVPYSYMLGDDWSDITTTLGSLDAKETSTNPDFSALIVRLLHEANVSDGDKVGVILSGSFPSLAVSVLAALQTMKIDALVMSSLGASTYGANQPEATWLDIETALYKSGGLKFRSILVSAGAGDDNGKGLSPEGLADIQQAAYRNKVNLYTPSSLKESIDKRFEIFNNNKITLLINIGGNETALGGCTHSLSIPNGLHSKLKGCNDETRGLIIRMNELKIPVINMLDIKNLAVQYGIEVSPGINYAVSTNLFSITRTNKPVLGIILVIGLIPVFFLKKRISAL
jgi:poly-gamma-glutamate system protein